MHKPDEMAIERVFMHRNADSALKLGQARGAAICAAVSNQLPVSEYAPREIKQAVVGKGGADKRQVQHMVCVLLSLAQIQNGRLHDLPGAARSRSGSSLLLKNGLRVEKFMGKTRII